MELLNDYFELQKKVYDYFDYQEDWVVIPLDDCTGYYWKLDGEAYGGQVLFAEDKDDVVNETGNHYANPIYTQRFLPKWVYRGEDYTMICADTQTDGNKFLQVFDNDKEIKHEAADGTV